MSAESQRLQSLLGGDALAGLRRRLARRCLKANADAFTLGGLSDIERSAMEGLLGRPARTASSMRLSLSALDEALARAGLATDLRSALEALDGPLIDPAAQRLAEERLWQKAFETVVQPQLRSLCASAKGRRLIKRLADGPDSAATLLKRAEAVLARLPEQGLPLARLAAETLGDAHALDNGRPEATLVLGATLPAEEQDEDARARDRWARLGVAMNALARPVLALNLPAASDTPSGAIADRARELGEPIHLSLRGLLRCPPNWLVAGQAVYVCENPSIVAIAADRFGDHAPPMFCTDGMPAAAQRTLLRQLSDAGAGLRYHGDYDWDGLRIANFVIDRFGARPWRFGAVHYRPRESGRVLEGTPVVATWDTELAPAMQRAGKVLEEEAVVDDLLDGLL
ncbi:TIGR02679 family protein [Algiphilus aromaticivorans]|uniref:TIGR02679 family protein n=1 Tax=Algiphilus aromaticivorans TaxID=382454 RepID=UPI0005C1B4F6|nr:TIGR02679 family protein [Algiphilus aromaticivorans]